MKNGALLILTIGELSAFSFGSKAPAQPLGGPASAPPASMTVVPAQRPITNTLTGEVLIPTGRNFVGTRNGRVYIPAGPNGVIDTRGGAFVPIR